MTSASQANTTNNIDMNTGKQGFKDIQGKHPKKNQGLIKQELK